MIKLPLDQGIPPGAALLLREDGWDFVPVGKIGMASSSDAEILEFAREAGPVCVTLDADFHALLAVAQANSHQLYESESRD